MIGNDKHLLSCQVMGLEPGSRQLRWLDVSGKYLSKDGASLSPDLVFDGTHMAPKFMIHVNEALEKLLDA